MLTSSPSAHVCSLAVRAPRKGDAQARSECSPTPHFSTMKVPQAADFDQDREKQRPQVHGSTTSSLLVPSVHRSRPHGSLHNSGPRILDTSISKRTSLLQETESSSGWPVEHPRRRTTITGSKFFVLVFTVQRMESPSPDERCPATIHRLFSCGCPPHLSLECEDGLFTPLSVVLIPLSSRSDHQGRFLRDVPMVQRPRPKPKTSTITSSPPSTRKPLGRGGPWPCHAGGLVESSQIENLF